MRNIDELAGETLGSGEGPGAEAARATFIAFLTANDKNPNAARAALFATLAALEEANTQPGGRSDSEESAERQRNWHEAAKEELAEAQKWEDANPRASFASWEFRDATEAHEEAIRTLEG